MRSNVLTETPKNYSHRNLYCPLLDSEILQLDQQFFGYAEVVMRLSSLLPGNIVTTNFCKTKTSSQFVFSLNKSAVEKILSKSF